MGRRGRRPTVRRGHRCGERDQHPDRASFTIAYQTARNQVIQAANVIAGTAIDLVGTIGRHILADLMPARRLRMCPRIVKRAISKYQAR